MMNPARLWLPRVDAMMQQDCPGERHRHEDQTQRRERKSKGEHACDAVTGDVRPMPPSVAEVFPEASDTSMMQRYGQQQQADKETVDSDTDNEGRHHVDRR